MKNSVSYKAFVNRFRADFKRRPTADHVMGYDFGMYVLALLDGYDYQLGMPLDQYLRNAMPHQGFHLGFHFKGHNDNQSVHVCRFGGRGFEKVQ